MNCEICKEKKCEYIFIYNAYIKILEKDDLDPEIKEKIKNFKNRKKESICICDDCKKNIMK